MTIPEAKEDKSPTRVGFVFWKKICHSFLVKRKIIAFIFVLFGFAAIFVSYKTVERVLFESQANQVPANFLIDASLSFESDDHWRNLAQGGEEKGRSLKPVVEKIKPLRPSYIRIDHVYDFYVGVSYAPDGKPSYDFSELDLYVEDILETGATPFFSLSYTPKALSVVSEVDMPTNLQSWADLVQATIERYSGRNGRAIPNVYYEVWNEPDLFGEFKMGGAKDYLDLYKASSDGARRARNTLSFKFGGPATTALYKNWFDGLVGAARSQNLRLDFFSWHRYAKDISTFEKDIKEVKLWLANANFTGLELIISETGIDSNINPSYDNNLSGMHSLATIAALDSHIDRIFHFEIKDGYGPKKHWGRWGVLTHEGWGEPETKPRYDALVFANNLMNGRRLNVAGNGSALFAMAREFDGGEVIKVLVVNYDQNGRNRETAPISIVGLGSGEYELTTRRFRGSVSKRLYQTTDGTINFLEYFPPLSATIFELRKTSN